MLTFLKTLYAALLWLYPREFRTGYQQPMIDLLDDQLAAADSPARQARVLLRGLADLPGSALREHIAAMQTSLTADLRQPGGLPLLTLLLGAAPGLWLSFTVTVGRIDRLAEIEAGLLWISGLALAGLTLWAWMASIRRGVILPGWHAMGLALITVAGVLGLSVAGDWLRARELSTLFQMVPLGVLVALLCLPALPVMLSSRIPRRIWWWLGLAVIVSIVGRLIGSLAYDGDPFSLLMGALFNPVLIAIYLVPLLAGSILARRHGSAAILYPATLILMMSGLDLDYGLAMTMDAPLLIDGFVAGWFILAFTIMPLGLLAARSERGRLAALLLPVGIATLLQALIHGIARLDLSGAGWPYLVSRFTDWVLVVGLMLIFALKLYQALGESAVRTEGEAMEIASEAG